MLCMNVCESAPESLHSSVQSSSPWIRPNRWSFQLLDVVPRTSRLRRRRTTEQHPVGVVTWHGSGEAEFPASADVAAESIEEQNDGEWETSGDDDHRHGYHHFSDVRSHFSVSCRCVCSQPVTTTRDIYSGGSWKIFEGVTDHGKILWS